MDWEITPIALLSKIHVKVAGNYLLIDSYLLNPSDCNCRISGLSICPFVGYPLTQIESVDYQRGSSHRIPSDSLQLVINSTQRNMYLNKYVNEKTNTTGHIINF